MTIQIVPDTLPDYHFLFIAPNLDANWLFTAARRYWNRFTPTIISSNSFLQLAPLESTVVVSLLTQRDAFRAMAVQIAQARADAYVDALVYETLEEAKLALDSRADNNQPFGVPLRPTEIPPTREIIEVTPGSILATPDPNRTIVTPSSGFITQTPSPTPNWEVDEDNSAPIDPTPGSIIGG